MYVRTNWKNILGINQANNSLSTSTSQLLRKTNRPPSFRYGLTKYNTNPRGAKSTSTNYCNRQSAHANTKTREEHQAGCGGGHTLHGRANPYDFHSPQAALLSTMAIVTGRLPQFSKRAKFITPQPFSLSVSLSIVLIRSSGWFPWLPSPRSGPSRYVHPSRGTAGGTTARGGERESVMQARTRRGKEGKRNVRNARSSLLPRCPRAMTMT